MQRKMDPVVEQNGNAAKETSSSVLDTLSDDLKTKILSVFSDFDEEGVKMVDVREVGTILRSLGSFPTEADLKNVIQKMEDIETPGAIHIQRFLPVAAEVICSKKYPPPTMERLQEAFRLLDPEGKGSVSHEHLGKLLCDPEIGEPLNTLEMEEMLTAFTIQASKNKNKPHEGSEEVSEASNAPPAVNNDEFLQLLYFQPEED